MKQLFQCEKCGIWFRDSNDCKQHELKCQQLFPIKGIFISLSPIDKNEKIDINILEYPNACLEGKDEVKLFSSYHLNSIPLNVLHLDKVHVVNYEWQGDYLDTVGIYTTDFSKEHEDKCIQELLKYRKEHLLKQYAEAMKFWQQNIKQLERNIWTNDTLNIQRQKDSKICYERNYVE